jgi:hypothetical protein
LKSFARKMRRLIPESQLLQAPAPGWKQRRAVTLK